MEQGTRRSRRQKEQQQTELQNQTLDQMTVVNLRQLELASLKKYKRTFKVRTKQMRQPDDEDLYASVVKHFASSDPPPQDETLETFIHRIKSEQASS